MQLFDCSYNKLDFSDARELRIADTISTLTNYTYNPQNPFGIPATFERNLGDTLTLSIANQDSALSYQWFRGTDTIIGATDTLLIIPNITLADSGIYTCRSIGTALLYPSPMNFSPGINSFVSEPFTVNIPDTRPKAFIPDSNFRNFLNATYPTFIDGSGDSLVIDSAATLTGTLNCNSQNITDLTGVEFFVNITNLYCNSNQLTTLPNLDSLTSLQRLYCYNNQLTTLPGLTNNTTLQYLYCYNNQLTTLPDLTNNTALQYLRCNNNQITALPDLTNNTTLQYLHCHNNQITVLPDLTNNTALLYLDCNNNQLTTLPDLMNSTALLNLYCNNNKLTVLPDFTNNTALEELMCSYNQLTALPDLSNNIVLYWLECDNNKLDFSDARELRIADTLPDLIVYEYSPQNPFGIPDTIDLNPGDTLILSIANQDSALSYQWFRGTDTITGATDTLLIILNVTLTDSGVYTCRSYGTALDTPPMINGFGISSFVSEPLTVNIISAPLSASISYQKNASCNGGMDGEAAVTVTGGTSPYTLQWSDSSAQTTDTVYNLNAGIYYVVATDSLGTTDTAYVTLDEPLVVTGSQTLILCSGDSVTVGSNVYDSTGAYTDLFMASNGCDSIFTTNLTVDTAITGIQTLSICAGDSIIVGSSVYNASGIYTDILTSTKGCDSVNTTNLTVTDLPVVSITGLDTNYCLNDAVETLTGTPAGGIFSGAGMNGTQFSPANADTGTHTITYYYTDGNNCTDSVSQNVTVNICTGINNQSSTNNIQLKIYPNPNTGVFTVEMEIPELQDIIISITNILGQSVYKEMLSKNIYKKQIDLNATSTGIYNLQVVIGKEITNKKIIIK